MCEGFCDYGMIPIWFGYVLDKILDTILLRFVNGGQECNQNCTQKCNPKCNENCNATATKTVSLLSPCQICNLKSSKPFWKWENILKA